MYTWGTCVYMRTLYLNVFGEESKTDYLPLTNHLKPGTHVYMGYTCIHGVHVYTRGTHVYTRTLYLNVFGGESKTDYLPLTNHIE